MESKIQKSFLQYKKIMIQRIGGLNELGSSPEIETDL